MKSSFKLLLAILLSLILSSCFALQNFSKNTKTTQGYSSGSIFLDPDLISKKQVYLNFRNSTIYEDFEVQTEIENILKKRNFEIVESVDAPIRIQANLRYYGLFEREILNAMLEDKTKKDSFTSKENFEDFSEIKRRSKYDVDFSGIAIGSVIGFAIFHTIYGAIIGGAVFGGGAIFFEHIYESKIVLAMLDIEVSEKINHQIEVKDFRQVIQGVGGTRKEEETYYTNYRSYKSIGVIVSKNVLLSDETAISDVKKQIISMVVGIL